MSIRINTLKNKREPEAKHKNIGCHKFNGTLKIQWVISSKLNLKAVLTNREIKDVQVKGKRNLI